jgi:hypothetical protein
VQAALSLATRKGNAGFLKMFQQKSRLLPKQVRAGLRERQVATWAVISEFHFGTMALAGRFSPLGPRGMDDDSLILADRTYPRLSLEVRGSAECSGNLGRVRQRS